MSDPGKTNISRQNTKYRTNCLRICFPDTSDTGASWELQSGSLGKLWKLNSLFLKALFFQSALINFPDAYLSSLQKEDRKKLNKALFLLKKREKDDKVLTDVIVIARTLRQCAIHRDRKEEKSKEDLDLKYFQSLLSILMWFIKECLMVECTLTFCWNGFTVHENVLFLTREFEKRIQLPW